jgi:penicillin-binding protein 1C
MPKPEPHNLDAFKGTSSRSKSFLSRGLGWAKGRWRTLGLLSLVLGVAFFVPPLRPEYRDLQANNSLILTDRNGRPLRRQLSNRDGVNSWATLDTVPQNLIESVLEAEDGRFYWHLGIDPLALVRASKDNILAGHVVSGASTITQQLLRTLDPPTERTLWSKLSELYWATRLEFCYSKDEILEAYLNRVAFGPSVYGAEEASRYYFDKPVSALSTAEAVALAVTIRSPSVLDPFTDHGQEELARWTGPLIDSLERRGFLDAEQAERAKSQELELSPNPPPFEAPHFCELALRNLQDHRGQIMTSLDADLQATVEGLVTSHLALLREHKVGNAAVVVAEVDSGEILALAGSAGFQRRRDGQHNAAAALRQPGSTIKPFTYALLLQRTGQAGYILPDLDLYEDADQESFVPKNYDQHFHGPVSIRTSLACSYNVPAVRALERVGPKNLLTLLRRIGFEDLTEPPEHYGLGLTLGDGSSSLLQLVAGYRTLARGGMYGPLTLFRDQKSHSDEAIVDPRSSYIISDILADRQARIASFGTPNSLEFPFDCAVKTGTSKGYRDNWAIGYTPKHVVGVWVGNSDGAPMQDVSGITGAGPLFRDVVLSLGSGGDFVKPKGLNRLQICGLSGDEATAKCPSSLAELGLEEVPQRPCRVCLSEVRDLESGELAESSTPSYRKFTRTVFDMPPLYQEWAAEKGLPQKARGSNSQGLRFVFPLSQDLFLADPDLDPTYQRVKFRIVGGTPPYVWEVDGAVVSEAEGTNLWWQLIQGAHSVRVTDSQGVAKEIEIRVLGAPTG